MMVTCMDCLKLFTVKQAPPMAVCPGCAWKRDQRIKRDLARYTGSPVGTLNTADHIVTELRHDG